MEYGDGVQDFYIGVFEEVLLVGRYLVFYCCAWRLSEIR